MKRISIVLFMLVALVATACTSEQGASPSGSASAAAEESEAAAESQAAGESQAPEESADDGNTGALPSFELPASAPELAALLPDEILGQEAVKISMSGEEMMEGEEEIDPEFISFLERLGAQPDQISFAFSFGFDAEGASAGIAAFRVEGANSDELEAEFQATLESDGTPIEWEEISLAGKDVLTAQDPETPENQVYVYTVGDIVFFVTATNEATAVELLEPLP